MTMCGQSGKIESGANMLTWKFAKTWAKKYTDMTKAHIFSLKDTWPKSEKNMKNISLKLHR